MHKHLLLIQMGIQRSALFLCAFLCCACANAVLEFSPPFIDFGDLRFIDIDEVTTVVTVTNNSDKATKLKIVESSCACTTATDFPRTLAPHESKPFSVKLKRSILGKMDHSISIDDANVIELSTIYVSGNVLPSGKLRMLPDPCVLTTTMPVGRKIGSIYLEIVDSRISPQEIGFVSSSDLFKIGKLEVTTSHTIKAALLLNRPLPLGVFDETISAFSAKRCVAIQTFSISMTTGINIHPQKIFFGFIPVGDSEQRELVINDPSFRNPTVELTGVDLSHYEIQASTSSDDTVTSIVVRCKPLVKGTFNGLLKVNGNLGENALRFDIPVQGGAF